MKQVFVVAADTLYLIAYVANIGRPSPLVVAAVRHGGSAGVFCACFYATAAERFRGAGAWVMTVVAMDVFAVVKELKAAGFTEEQAEAVTRVVRKGQDIDFSELATKTDLQLGLAATKADLQLALAETRAELERKLGESKTELQLGLAETRAELERKLVETKTELQLGLAATKADLERNLGETKAELLRSLGETKAEILKWVLGTVGLQTVVIIGAVLALARSMGHG